MALKSSCVPTVQSDFIWTFPAGQHDYLSEKQFNPMPHWDWTSIQILVNLVNKLWFECDVYMYVVGWLIIIYNCSPSNIVGDRKCDPLCDHLQSCCD